MGRFTHRRVNIRRRLVGLVAFVALVGVGGLLIIDKGNEPRQAPSAALPRDDLDHGVHLTLGMGDASARALVTLPDNSVAVAAATTNGAEAGTTIVRRGPNGERLADVNLAARGEPYGLASLPDGGLAVLLRKNGRFDVERITPRGAVDRRFGEPALSNIADGSAGALAVGVDGRFAIASDGGPAVLDVTRLSPSGRAPSSTEIRADDANLNPREQAAQPASPVGAIYTSDGGLLVGAASPVGDGATARPEIIRLDASGGVGGVALAAPAGRWSSFTALADGSTIVAGSIRQNGRSVLAAVKFTAHRQIDKSFGQGGLATARLPADAYAGAVVADPRGGLVFGVNTSDQGHPETTLVKLGDDGSVDPGFHRVSRPGRLGGISFDRAERLLLTTSAFNDGGLRVGLYRLRV
jgi:hypothetical protein